jgi:HSF-type DNA-binding
MAEPQRTSSTSTGSNNNNSPSQSDNGNGESTSRLVASIDQFLQAAQSNDPENAPCIDVPASIEASIQTVDFASQRSAQVALDSTDELKETARSTTSPVYSSAIQHDFRDLTIPREKPPIGHDTTKQNEDLSSSKTQKSSVHDSSQKITTFPHVLHMMLEAAHENGYDDVVSWQDHGRSFRIKDKKRLVTEVMPRYFNQKNYASFTRQLALYSFIRLTRKAGEDAGCYFHEHFVRGDPDRIRFIRRVPIKKAARASSDTESDTQSIKHAAITQGAVTDTQQDPIDSRRQQTTSEKRRKQDPVKLESKDKKVPSKTTSKAMAQRHDESTSRIDSKQSDDQESGDYSLLHSMDDGEEVDDESMAEFLSDI